MTNDPFAPPSATSPATPSPHLPTSARRRRLPVWASVLIGAVVGLGLLAVGFVLWIAAALSGGIDDLVAFNRPQADDRTVVRAGDVAERDVEALLDDLTRGLPVTDTGVRAATRSCQTGQHNWKIDDPYDLDCSVSRSMVMSPSAQLALTAAAVEAQLTGWTEQTGPYDRSSSRRWTRGGDPNGEAGVQEVTVRPLGGTSGRVTSYDLGYAATVTRDGREVEPEQVLLDRDGYIVVTVSERYFYD